MLEFPCLISGGYVWAYNTQPYYTSLGQTPQQIAGYMSWIPLVGGSLGVVAGGFISDRLVKNHGPTGRVLVIVVSLVCNFLSDLPNYHFKILYLFPT